MWSLTLKPFYSSCWFPIDIVSRKPNALNDNLPTKHSQSVLTLQTENKFQVARSFNRAWCQLKVHSWVSNDDDDDDGNLWPRVQLIMCNLCPMYAWIDVRGGCGLYENKLRRDGSDTLLASFQWGNGPQWNALLMPYTLFRIFVCFIRTELNLNTINEADKAVGLLEKQCYHTTVHS
jgi:hypothetical protein